jgi:hypothetical protein
MIYCQWIASSLRSSHDGKDVGKQQVILRDAAMMPLLRDDGDEVEMQGRWL